MKLVRLATMYFEPSPEGWNSWETRVGDVIVGTIPISNAPPIGEKLRLLVRAETVISFPDIDSQGFVILPQTCRRRCEEALGNVANLLPYLGDAIGASPHPFPVQH